MGTFIMLDLKTMENISNTFAQLQIHDDLSKGLHAQIVLDCKDSRWTQSINYENIASNLGHIFSLATRWQTTPNEGSLKGTWKKQVALLVKIQKTTRWAVIG
jgi:hypothetical protein